MMKLQLQSAEPHQTSPLESKTVFVPPTTAMPRAK
jgi:hypothetical protein